MSTGNAGRGKGKGNENLGHVKPESPNLFLSPKDFFAQ